MIGRRAGPAQAAKCLGWFGLVFGLSGALAVALNISITGWGFVALAASAVFWIVSAALTRNTPLALTQVGFFFLHLLAVWRWLL